MTTLSIILSSGIFSGIFSGMFTLWFTKAVDKFNKLKSEHKKRARWFAKVYIDKDTSEDVKKGLFANNTTRSLIIEGQTADDEVINFSNTWKQFFKCFIKPF